MPIGYDCEYPDFDACVADNQNKEDPEGYCAKIQEETEDKCASNSARINALTAAAVPGPTVEALDRRADRYERLLGRMFDRVADLAARRVRRSRSAAQLSDRDLNVIRAEWQQIAADEMYPELEHAWLKAANDQLTVVRAALPLLAAVSLEDPQGVPEPVVPPPYVSGSDAAAVFLSTALNRLVDIGDLYWDAAREALHAGMLLGEGVPKLAKRVVEATGVALPRATVIARTEIISASNAGSIAAMRALSGLVVTKKWLATASPICGTKAARGSKGPCTRASHMNAWGQEVPLAGKFTVGAAQLDHPGDPSGPAEEVISCRCAMEYGLDRPPTSARVVIAGAPVHVSRETLTAANDTPGLTDRSGMVALRPADPDSLTVDGGLDPADLHVTLMFLGDETPENVETAAVDAAEQAGRNYGPFTARVGGYGTLGDDGAFVLFLNGDGLAELHDHCMATLADVDGMHEQHQPWIPHMTLTYGAAPADPDSFIGREVTFDAVTADIGEDQTRFELSGTAATVPATTGSASTVEGGVMAEDETSSRVPWHGVIAVEGVPTGDGREFAKGSLTWPDGGVVFQWQKETTHGGINDVVVEIGRVETIERKGKEIRGTGFIDTATEDGAEYARRREEYGPGGVSVVADDPEHAEVEYRYPEGCDDLLEKSEDEIEDVPLEELFRCMEPEVVIFHSGRIRAVTGVDTPAFVEAKIEIDAEVASAVTIPVTLSVDGEAYEVANITSLSGLSDALVEVAARILTEANDAPAEVFEKAGGKPSQGTDKDKRLKRNKAADTETMSAVGRHKTATDDGDWDEGANRKNLPSPCAVSKAKQAAAYVDEDRAEDGEVPKDAISFIHHNVSDGGDVGAANLTACSSGIGILNGARGGWSGGDRDGIYNHLAGHLSDADREPPELQSVDDPETTETAEPTTVEVELPEALVAAAYTVTIPDVPPVDWYLEPASLPPIGAISVTAEGRIFGLLAPARVGHRAFPDQRTEVPRGNVDYSRFMNRPTKVTLADGTVEDIPAGVVTMNCGHAKPLSSIDTGKAMEHYADSCSIVATVRVGENDHGVWVAGALMPGIETNDLARLLACQLSGDWRPHQERSGMRELAGALLVPMPGFAVAGPTVRLDHGELVAAAAPVVFTDNTDVTFPQIDLDALAAKGGDGKCDPETDPDCEEHMAADSNIVDDLPDFQSVIEAQTPAARAAKLAAELGLDRESRLAALVAAVKGGDA